MFTPRDKAVRKAMERAGGFLISQQLANGGFYPFEGADLVSVSDYEKENPEVNSEALQALGRVRNLDDD